MSLIAKRPVILEPGPGDEISNSIREAQKLAVQLGGLVVVKFNGIPLRVRAGADRVALVDQYYRKLSEELGRKRGAVVKKPKSGKGVR